MAAVHGGRFSTSADDDETSGAGSRLAKEANEFPQWHPHQLPTNTRAGPGGFRASVPGCSRGRAKCFSDRKRMQRPTKACWSTRWPATFPLRLRLLLRRSPQRFRRYSASGLPATAGWLLHRRFRCLLGRIQLQTRCRSQYYQYDTHSPRQTSPMLLTCSPRAPSPKD